MPTGNATKGNVIEWYRDELALDDALMDSIKNGLPGMPPAQPGDTVVLGARHLCLGRTTQPLPAYNLILLADHLDIAYGATVQITGTPEKNPRPSVTVLARFIGREQIVAQLPPGSYPSTGSSVKSRKALLSSARNLGTIFPLDEALTVKVCGYNGADGKPGRAGHEETDPEPRPQGRQGSYMPEVPAKPGGSGAAGGQGGTVVVRYVQATLPPVISAPGGLGGSGGAGDSGIGEFPPQATPIPAPAGDGGPGGRGGSVEVCHVGAHAPTASAPGGSGGAGGAAGQGRSSRQTGKKGATGASGSATVREIAGIDEVWAAIPTKDIARHWAACRTEVGAYFFRCFDNLSMITAIKELQAATMLDPGNKEAALLFNRILNGQTPGGQPRYADIVPDYKDLVATVSAAVPNVLQAFLAAQVDNITADVCQNAAKTIEATVRLAEQDLNRAQFDLAIAQSVADVASSRAAGIQQQLDDLANQQFSILDMVVTVGAAAAAIGSIVSGVGAIISIPSSLMAIGKIAETTDDLVTFLQNKELQTDLSKLGQGMEGLLKVGQGIINLKKVVAQIEEAMAEPGQGKAGDLLKQLAQARWEEAIANLRVLQAKDYCDGLAGAIEADNAAITNINSLMTEDLIPGTLSLLRQARAFASQVSEQLFLAARALEIYELETPTIRFDYGYIWPDTEHDRIDGQSLHDDVRDSYRSALEMPCDLATWSDIYNRVNTAQVGFSVVHGNTPITILADDAVRTALAPGNALRFTVHIDDLPSSIFEDKVNGLDIDVFGATADESVMLWVEHSGHYWMRRRDNGSIEEFYLFPRREICNCTSSDIGLSGDIPFAPQSPAEPGPPFSFWGRGMAADWILYMDPGTSPAAHFDVADLSKVVVTIRGLGFSPTASPPQTPMIRVSARPIIGWRPVPSTIILDKPVVPIAQLEETLELVGAGKNNNSRG